MKSNRILAICILLISVGFLNAQTTIYDANRWMGSDLNGTARFVGMGGAMGALGGDITTMGTNPAGICILYKNRKYNCFEICQLWFQLSQNEVLQQKYAGEWSIQYFSNSSDG